MKGFARVTLLALAMGLTACGGSDDPPAPAATDTPTVPAVPDVATPATPQGLDVYVGTWVDPVGLWQFTNTQSLGPPPFGAEVFGNAGTLAYTAPPAANPITYRLVSLAGNGLPQQTAFTASGHCASLPLPPAPTVAAVPTLGEWALMALSAVLMLWGAGAAQRRRRP